MYLDGELLGVAAEAAVARNHGHIVLLRVVAYRAVGYRQICRHRGVLCNYLHHFIGRETVYNYLALAYQFVEGLLLPAVGQLGRHEINGVYLKRQVAHRR